MHADVLARRPCQRASAAHQHPPCPARHPAGRAHHSSRTPTCPRASHACTHPFASPAPQGVPITHANLLAQLVQLDFMPTQARLGWWLCDCREDGQLAPGTVGLLLLPCRCGTSFEGARPWLCARRRGALGLPAPPSYRSPETCPCPTCQPGTPTGAPWSERPGTERHACTGGAAAGSCRDGGHGSAAAGSSSPSPTATEPGCC